GLGNANAVNVGDYRQRNGKNDYPITCMRGPDGSRELRGRWLRKGLRHDVRLTTSVAVGNGDHMLMTACCENAAETRNPKSEGRRPKKYEGGEPIAKLPRSAISKTRSPSSQPSPSGRGRTNDGLAKAPSGSACRMDWRSCSLSLRERAGVRGNGSCEYQRCGTFAIASRNPKMSPGAVFF